MAMGPPYGSHAWPSLAGAIITVVEDHRVAIVLDKLRQLNDERPKLGLRAFVWNVEVAYADLRIFRHCGELAGCLSFGCACG